MTGIGRRGIKIRLSMNPSNLLSFSKTTTFLIVTRLILEITGRKFNKRVGRGEKGITVYRYISVTDLSIESRENETEIF